MTQKTMILGKDAPLEDSIARMKKLLLDSGFEVEEASWLNPVQNVWSVHIRDSFFPNLFTNGKGTTKDATLASALGEFFERLNCNYFFADFYLGEKLANAPFVHYPTEKWFPIAKDDKLPGELLNKELLAHYDPNQELKASMLVDTNSGNKERGIVALPFVRARDEKTTWIPMNIVGNLYVSNGMSAGNTMVEARVQALSEIFERGIKNKIISEGIALPVIPNEVLNKYPKVVAAIAELEAAGYPIICKDASLGGRYPVINVTLLNPKNGTVFASFGAHPKFQVALERTLTELLQGRSLETLDVFSPASFDLDAVAENFNIEAHFIDSNGLIHWDFFSQKADFEFSDWNFDGNTEQEYNGLMNVLHQMEKDAYIMDYNHLGVYGCRILVPGMSEIYKSEDLVWDNNNSGYDVRKDILGAHSLTKEASMNLYDKLEEKGFDEMFLVAHAIGVVTDANTVWANLRMGEFKTMLALHAGELELAKQGTDWVIHFAPLTQERKNLYLCLDTLLQLKMDENRDVNDYLNVVERLYTKDLVNTATNIIEGKESFNGLHKTDMNLTGFNAHQKLITSYEKLQKAKAKAANLAL